MRMTETTTPRPFQFFGTFRALTAPVFMLGLPTGTGKTFVSYLIFAYYRSKKAKTKMLVSTKNSAILQFSKEWGKFFNDHTVVNPIFDKMDKKPGQTYANARADVIDMWARESDPNNPMNKCPDIIVIGHAGLRLEEERLMDALKMLQRQGYDVIFVLDEATIVKNFKAATHHVVSRLAKMCVRKIPMTATMTKGKLEEIYMIFRCFGMMLTKNKEEFLRDYTITHGEGENSKILGYKNAEHFVKLLSKISLVLRKRDIAKWLPAFTPSFSWVKHDKVQVAYLKDLLNDVIKGTDPETGEPKDLIAITQVLYQKMALADVSIIAPPEYIPDGYVSPKTEELLVLLEEEYISERVIIYTPYVRHIENLIAAIKRYSNKLDRRYAQPLRITGAESTREKEDNRVAFTEGTHHRLIIVNDAGLEALNLQASNNLVCMVMPKTGGDLIQLAGRISRMDTVHTNLNIRYMLTEDSMDVDDYAIVMQQAAIIARVQGGEPEPGLVDEEILSKAMNKSEDEIKAMTSDTADKFLMHSRKARKAYYNRLAAGK